MDDAQKYLIAMITGDVFDYGEAIWEKNVLYAANLIETDFPIEKMKNFELHALIAYAAHYLDAIQVEDAQTNRLFDDMNDTFWWCVLQLATKKLKRSPQVSYSEFALIGCSQCGATGQPLTGGLCPLCFLEQAHDE